MTKKKFWTLFGIAFAAAAAVTVFMLLVVFRGLFFNIYKSRGDAKLEAGLFTEAIDCYETARSWKPKKQEGYLLLAKAYAEAEDYDSAGDIIDEAIKKKVTTKDSGLEDLYLMRIKVYSISGKLSEAVNYINSLSDQYILKKIEAARPADLSYTPTQGSYDKSLKMTITVREGETVYYTTDGSYPTKFSNIYVDPINIPNGTTRITAVSVNAEGLVSPMLSVTYKVTNDYEVVSFDDPKMEKMVRAALNKPTGSIRMKELDGVTELSNENIEGSLKTLSDLELMPNLRALYLENETKLVSTSQLSGRTALAELVLSGCGLDSTDINALGSLSALEMLDLSDNNITSISVLSNLPELKYVYLTRNVIEDISPLASLKALRLVEASENRIAEIPELSETLETLYLAKNSITELSSVHVMEGLKLLDVSGNLISNAKNLGKLTSLETLSLSGNNIVNFDFLSGLSALSSLDVSATGFISTKPLKNLPLVSLNASTTELSSLSDIKNIKTLVSLSIADTPVTDIEPLTELKNLDYLDISDCEIKDVDPLGDISGLYTLVAQNVDVTDVTFANPEITIVETK